MVAVPAARVKLKRSPRREPEMLISSEKPADNIHGCPATFRAARTPAQGFVTYGEKAMSPGPPSPLNRMPTGVRPCRGEILAALSRVLDYMPSAGVPHHARVAVLAARMSSFFRRADRLDTFYAGLIHDIGLLSEDRDPDRWFSMAEQANQPLIRSHPLVGAQMVAALPELLGVAEIILDHHECVNGHGYPRGRRGDEIPPGAQILRFAATCDLVLREQTWPELISFLDALRQRAGVQVEPSIADAGIEVLGDTGFYAQLLAPEDVALLVQSTLHRLALEDLVVTEPELTGLLELFAHTTDAHPADKIGHSRRVADLSVLVAMALGVPASETAKIKWAALVHDIGLIAVPKALLDKPGSLTKDELDEVRRQVVKTEEFLSPVRGLEEVTAIAAAHGEAFDGSGYPRGLAGRGIPLGARIIAVCDTFDALTSHRPYREARDAGLAIDILVKGSGAVFDPDVVEAAVPALLIARSAEEPQTVGAKAH